MGRVWHARRREERPLTAVLTIAACDCGRVPRGALTAKVGLTQGAGRCATVFSSPPVGAAWRRSGGAHMGRVCHARRRVERPLIAVLTRDACDHGRVSRGAMTAKVAPRQELGRCFAVASPPPVGAAWRDSGGAHMGRAEPPLTAVLTRDACDRGRVPRGVMTAQVAPTRGVGRCFAADSSPPVGAAWQGSGGARCMWPGLTASPPLAQESSLERPDLAADGADAPRMVGSDSTPRVRRGAVFCRARAAACCPELRLGVLRLAAIACPTAADFLSL